MITEGEWDGQDQVTKAAGPSWREAEQGCSTGVTEIQGEMEQEGE